VRYAYACDDEVIETFQLVSRMEGILPALESTHAIVEGLKRAKQMCKDELLLINLSGRGDKDVNQIAKMLGVTLR
jgi:tryptophan synthase beta chain